MVRPRIREAAKDKPQLEGLVDWLIKDASFPEDQKNVSVSLVRQIPNEPERLETKTVPLQNLLVFNRE